MLDTMDGVWTIPPLRCREWRGERADDGVRYIQPKWDGWQLTFLMQEDPVNGLCVFGRKREAHLELSHHPGVARRPWYRALAAAMRPGDSLVAEAHVPGRPASAVTSALRDHSMPLELVPLAVPTVGFRPGPDRMDDARYQAVRFGVQGWPVTLAYTDQTREELDEYALAWRAEGVVLKAGPLPAEDGTGWYKVKLERTADVICTDVKVALTGTEYAGLAASIHGSVYVNGQLREVACVPGLSADERREAVEKDPRGRVFEVKYQYVSSQGRLRHPRFLRWREDKEAIDCRDDQLEGDR